MSKNDFRKELEDAYPSKSNRLSKQNIGFVGANRNKQVDVGICGVSLDFETARPIGPEASKATKNATQPIASDKVPEDLKEKAEPLVEAKEIAVSEASSKDD
ncbi:MAG: hypothetical protein J0G29_01410 [Alphaproteobacteria bacterium]|nr:hypothetical protein [Alphaproteobacteria bacterium]OJV47533.1 MAG: hypothetical protein BGO28_06770 [Alphaproteobacteria bacterium 43-37]